MTPKKLADLTKTYTPPKNSGRKKKEPPPPLPPKAVKPPRKKAEPPPPPKPLTPEEILEKLVEEETAPPPEPTPVDAESAKEEYSKPNFDREEAKLDAKKALAKRLLAQRSLLHFIKRYRPNYEAGWVHKDICRRLERFMEQVAARKSPRLLLMMPYRHGKSEISSRHFAPWILGHHANWEIIAASNAQSLATSFSRYIRDVMRDPSYRAVFNNTQLDPSSQSVENWNTTEGGGYLAAGIGTAIIGRGAHVLIIDDPVRDAEAADSQVQRDNVWEWYLTTAHSRLSPGGGVLGIMTCWNDDDWGGRVIQAADAGGEPFEIVRYPAINDQGDEYILEDDSIQQFPPGSTVPESARLTRLHNSALHPERYTLEMLLQKKANYAALGQQRWWSAGYQQNPVPEDGLYFTKDMVRHYAMLPERSTCHVYQAWDFAISEGKENDYTVGITLYQDSFDNLYVADVLRFRSGDSFVIADTILDYAAQHSATLIGFEDGQIWKAMEAVFQRRCEERRSYPSFEVLRPLTDKLVRAQPLRGRMQAGKVYLDKDAHWYQPLTQEMLRFPAGKHDDQIDSLAWCVRLTLSHVAPRIKEPSHGKKPDRWKDKLSLSSSDAGHMAA